MARGIKVEIPESLLNWIKTETKLGNPALEKVVERRDPHLQQALKWSKAVNQAVEDIVRGVPPFPHVHECLTKLAAEADLLVVSATPNEALQARMGRTRHRKICTRDLRARSWHEKRSAS